MRGHRRVACAALVAAGCLFLLGCQKNWSETGTGPIKIVTNTGGQALGYSTASGVKLVFDKGFAFKDLNRNGKLDPYEDWRLSADDRAKDLASKLRIEQVARAHAVQRAPGDPRRRRHGSPRPTTASRLPKAARKPLT